jgi:hypothetical protein
MKLTTQQIEYVENYIIWRTNGMSYKMELTDHMVTSMEEF